MKLYEQIKNSLDIVDIIGERVRLKRSGRGFMGLCPFHDEKTPSFHVFADTQSYYCFGCHEAGDVFTFVMKTEGLNYSEALGLLAERAGIKITPYERRNNSEKSLHDVLAMAAKFFTDNLTGTQGVAARAYMQRRGLTANDISRFSLGYSLNSWDSLLKFLRHSGVKDGQILEAGLALQGSRGLYDRFRGRLIFPVRDVAGKVIAFGGRLIDGEGAKYINSPESEVYSKRKNLYLLNDAKKFIRERDRAILVEGYMDALRLHKCGFGEAVASLGTSLTAEQAELLGRFSKRCYICYDSDTAGQTATLRGMYILQEHGLDVRVVEIPEGKDPDEFLSANPPEDFETAIANATPLVLQQIKTLTPALNDPTTRKAATDELFYNFSKLDASEILPYRYKISELTLVPPSEIDRRLAGDRRLKFEATESEENFSRSDENLEAGLCAMLYNYAQCRLSIEPAEAYKILQGDLARETALSLLTENPDNLFAMWLSTGETDKTALIKRGEEFCKSIKMEPAEKWQNIYRMIKSNWVRRRIEAINDSLKKNQAQPSEWLELRQLREIQNQMKLV